MRHLLASVTVLLALNELCASVLPLEQAEAWKPMAGSKSPQPVTLGGRSALKFACSFAAGQIERVSWDAPVKLNMAASRGIELELHCADPSPVSYFSIYFQSGAGWYHGMFYPELTTGWNTITIDKSAMVTEGTPAGWANISSVRLSAWRGQNKETAFAVAAIREVGVLGQDASVAVLRADSLASAPGEGRSVEQFTENVARCLSGAGLGYSTLSDLDVTSSILESAKVLILPYNPRLPDAATGALFKYLDGGGKLIAFYQIPEALSKAAGFGLGRHVKAGYDAQFARIRFSERALSGAPELVDQASWNIISAEPIQGRSEVVAEWLDSKDHASGHPAVLRSTNAFLITHVLLADDFQNKERMLMAMLGSLAPELWKDAADKAIRAVGQLSSFTSFEQALAEISRLAEEKKEAREPLREAAKHRETAKSLAQAERFAESINEAGAAARLMEEAFCRAQDSATNEFRAFWCHSAFGVQGLSWEEAVSRLATNGFTAVIPNMLWGGAAYYPSRFLPKATDLEDRGDQIKECLKAARKHGIQVHVWKVNWNLGGHAPRQFVEEMRRERRLQARMDGTEEPWLCPSHPQNQKLEIESMVEIARNYNVDGIHFDYIRYPDGEHCFCAGCRERFSTATGLQITNWPGQVLANGSAREPWLQWRRNNITAVVKAVSEQARAVRPEIKISAAVFPNWSTDRDTIGQDWKLWCEKGYLDFVCPMDYTSSNNGFNNLVTKQVAWAGKVPCYPGIGESASASKFGADKVIDQINITRAHNTGGFVIFNYAQHEANELLPKLGLGVTARQTATRQ